MVPIKRVAVMVLAAVLASGCFPSRPYEPSYLTYRDGRYFVGVRCFPSLDRVEIGSTASDEPFWVAVTTRAGVGQVELFGTGQASVEVRLDDAARRADGNWWGSVWVTGYDYPASFGLRGAGGVVTYPAIPSGSIWAVTGVMSWEDYVKMPDGAFGVGAQEGRCNKS